MTSTSHSTALRLGDEVETVRAVDRIPAGARGVVRRFVGSRLDVSFSSLGTWRIDSNLVRRVSTPVSRKAGAFGILPIVGIALLAGLGAGIRVVAKRALREWRSSESSSRPQVSAVRTEEIKLACFSCSGSGRRDCCFCGGTRDVACNYCGLEGSRSCDRCRSNPSEREECRSCRGAREAEAFPCTFCKGEGTTACPSCAGTGKYRIGS